jgi:hypothetical protein
VCIAVEIVPLGGYVASIYQRMEHKMSKSCLPFHDFPISLLPLMKTMWAWENWKLLVLLLCLSIELFESRSYQFYEQQMKNQDSY